MADLANAFIALVEHAVAEGFVAPANRDLFLMSDEPGHLLDGLLSQSAAQTELHLHCANASDAGR